MKRDRTAAAASRTPARAAVADTWRPASVHVYRNWLLAMCAHKAAVLQRRDAVYGITSTAA